MSDVTGRNVRLRLKGVVRALTVAAPLAAAALFVIAVQGPRPTVLWNLAPLILTLVLALLALGINAGRWWQPDSRWPLAAAGFAVPAVGLTLYLHALWHYDINATRSSALATNSLFVYLPIYALLAGAIGFALGFRIGREVNRQREQRAIAKQRDQCDSPPP